MPLLVLFEELRRLAKAVTPQVCCYCKNMTLGQLVPCSSTLVAPKSPALQVFAAFWSFWLLAPRFRLPRGTGESKTLKRASS